MTDRFTIGAGGPLSMAQLNAIANLRIPSARASLRIYVPERDLHKLEDLGDRLIATGNAIRRDSGEFLTFVGNEAWTVLNHVYYTDVPRGHRKPTLYRDQWGQSVSMSQRKDIFGATVKLFADIAYAELLGGHTGPRGNLSQTEQRRIEWWMAQKMGMKNNKVIRAVIKQLEEEGQKGPSPFAAAFAPGSPYGTAFDREISIQLMLYLDKLLVQYLR